MVIDLSYFMIIWTIELMIFTSVSLILFGHLPDFTSFFTVFYYYFGAALGAYDMEVYC